jgi:predicted permease
VVARLAHGVAIDEAGSRLEASVAALPPGGSIVIRGVHLEPLSERYAAPVRAGLLLLQGICALLLLIGCANLANLFLAHGSTRTREFGVRLTLGAGGGRLIRQIATESSVLAVLGAFAGLLLAYFTLPALVFMAPWSLSHRADEIVLRAPELAFALGLSVTAALGAALAPAILASRADPLASLRGTASATPGRLHRLVKDGLVASQVVLAVVLLTGAGLMIRSFAALLSEPLGFDARDLVVAEVPLPGAYNDARRRAAIRQLHDELRGRLGPSSAAIGNSLPYGSTMMGPASPLLPSGTYGEFKIVPYRAVTHDYFDVFGIPLRRGRVFDAADVQGAPLAVVVNEQFVAEFSGGRELLGSQMRLGPRDVTVVGVVGDTRSSDAAGTRAAVYWSIEQRPVSELTVAVRARDLAAAVTAIGEVVRAIDPDLPVVRPQSMNQRIASARVARRFHLWMLSLLGFLGGTIAAVGVYGMVAHAVAMRRRELGIRTALGAGTSRIRRLVFTQGLRPVAVGLAAGLTAAWWITGVLAANRAFSQQLYGITAHDLQTFATAAGLVLLAGAIACWIPASRATRVDPAQTLRMD